MAMSMARSGSASVRHPSSGVMMMGVFIHPSHGVQLEMPSAPTTPMPAPTAFVNPFKATEDLLPSQMVDLSLSADSPPPSPVDYFSSRAFNHHRNSDSSFASSSTSCSSVDSSSSPSSAATTPTCESPYPKAPTLSRNNSSFGLYSESSACPSPQFPASFSFNTFAAPQSTPSSRPSSPPPSAPRGLPYARRSTGGSSMQRAVSSPVETQHALDLRTRAADMASEALHQQAGRVARSRSVVALPGLGLGLGSASMSRAGSRSPNLGGCPSPLVTPFEEGWGSALPLREHQAPEMIPFPYNIAITPQSPARLARSQSVSEEHSAVVPLPSGHRNSVPNIATRPRRGTGTFTLAPLTPILPSSPLSETSGFESFAEAIEARSPHTSPKKPGFHRGVTY